MERKKPLLLRGARQVGKSTLVRIAAREAARSLAVVNLERDAVALKGVFESNDPKLILKRIAAHTGVDLETAERPLLFLDEIQESPAALAALRYFFEEKPAVPVVAAGSTLEFALSDTKR